MPKNFASSSLLKLGKPLRTNASSFEANEYLAYFRSDTVLND